MIRRASEHLKAELLPLTGKSDKMNKTKSIFIHYMKYTHRRSIGQKARPLCFSACKFKGVYLINSKFDMNKVNFILINKS